MERVFIVGAGIAGLSAAAELAGSASVTVVDRLPAVGGTSRYDHPLVRQLDARCRQANVAYLLGTTALRWTDKRLLLAAPGAISWQTAERLIYAGGCRPGTSAEIRLAGSRLGGVIPATVAVHLLEANTVLGRRPIIIGASDWAEEVAAHFHAGGTPVCVVSRETQPAPAYADEWWPGWVPERVRGHGRVEELEVGWGGHRQRLLCDAVVLADAVRPLRNVEGALADDDDVTFIQLASAHAAPEAVAAYARGIAQAITSTVRRVPQ